MFSLREYREPTKRLPDLLPWAALIAPGVVLQKDGVLQRTIAFRGPDLASASSSELGAAVSRFNAALKRLGSGWAYFFEAQRFQSQRYPSARWPSVAPWLLDLERRDTYQRAGAHFESSYFLTLVWQMPHRTAKWAEQVFYDDPSRSDALAENAKDVEFFEKTTSEVVDLMRVIFPDCGELDDDQTLSYLHSTISTNRHPVKCPETPMYLDALLPDQAFTPGDIPLLGEHFIPTCTITGFPGTSLPGILDALNHLELEYRWVTRFICLDRDTARTEIEKYRKRWWQSRKSLFTLIKEEAAQQESALVNNAAANKAADADAALQELGDDLVAFGYLTTTVTVWDRELDTARRKMLAVKQAIQANDFVARDETLNSQDAWLGSLPGHVYANVRRPLVNTLNLAHMMPISAVWAGDEYNEHLRRVAGVALPHLVASTTGRTPYRLNLNNGDVGHTSILGPTGSGKSTLLGLLELQWLRYPRAKVVIFDKGRSALAQTLAVGGAYYEPGSERSPVAFQPLAAIDTRDERVWASQFVLMLLALQKVEESPAVKSAVDQALTTLASERDRSERTLTVFAAILGSFRNDLREALRPYTIEGNFGQIFDAHEDTLRDSSWSCFEMAALMDKGQEAVLPALAYLFHRIEAGFDGRPTLLVLDEAWLFLSHPTFAMRLQGWLKTLRKLNVYVVFATQELADFMAAERATLRSTVSQNCPTAIYLPDPAALDPLNFEVYKAFGLSEAEVQIIHDAQPRRDYYYRSPKGKRLFQLDLGPIGLALAAMSSPADQEFLGKLLAERPSPEECTRRIFARRSIPWPADVLDAVQQHGRRFYES